jgi:hypothetical protein
MSDFYRILYVNAGPDIGQDPLQVEMENLQKWMAGETARIRWIELRRTEITPETLAGFQFAIVAWPRSLGDVRNAVDLLQRIRRDATSLRLLVVKTGDFEDHRYGLECFSSDPCVQIRNRQHFGTREDSGKTLTSIGVEWPTSKFSISDHPMNPEVRDIIQSVDKKRLELILQRFFPDAGRAEIYPVTGGWSGAGLCRAFLDSSGEIYYFKFFRDPRKYEEEFANQAAAEDWLGVGPPPGGATVKLRLMPGIGKDVRSQLQEFLAGIPPPLFVLCYDCASTSENHRATLQSIYGGEPTNWQDGDTDQFLADAVSRLVNILAQKQSNDVEPRMPWDWHEGGQRCVPGKVRKGIRTATAHLRPLLAADKAWEGRVDKLDHLIYKLPPWLAEEPRPVTFGHVHGDPNVRNTLVAVNNPIDVRLIDCGGYAPNGSLVGDLALIERDIKLLLMATEPEAEPYFDLDVHQVGPWCRMEQECIRKRLEYSPEDATTGPSDDRSPWGRSFDAILQKIARARGGAYYAVFPGREPANGGYRPEVRAYRLIGRIRQRARDLCPPGDPDGRHYFGALLYWTLESLQYEAFKPVKKLLAIYSAAAILERFGNRAAS